MPQEQYPFMDRFIQGKKGRRSSFGPVRLSRDPCGQKGADDRQDDGAEIFVAQDKESDLRFQPAHGIEPSRFMHFRLPASRRVTTCPVPFA